MKITTDQNHYPLYFAFALVASLYVEDLVLERYWSAGFKATIVAWVGVVTYLVDRQIERNSAMQVRNKLRGY